MVPHGAVITNVNSLHQARSFFRESGMTLAKVVDGWGLGRSWERADILELRSFARLCVRSTRGDPSVHGGSLRHLIPDEVEASLAPFLDLVPDADVELGNEPNIALTDRQTMYGYRYWLYLTIERIRRRWPRATIIGPALILSGQEPGHPDYRQEREWLHVLNEPTHDQPGRPLQMCHLLGVHVYEHYGFLPSSRLPRLPATTGQAEQALRLLAPLNKPWAMTEYGINDPFTSQLDKGWRYGELVRRGRERFPGVAIQRWAAYHLCHDEVVHPQYALGRLAAHGYAQGLAGKEVAWPG